MAGLYGQFGNPYMMNPFMMNPYMGGFGGSPFGGFTPQPAFDPGIFDNLIGGFNDSIVQLGDLIAGLQPGAAPAPTPTDRFSTPGINAIFNPVLGQFTTPASSGISTFFPML